MIASFLLLGKKTNVFRYYFEPVFANTGIDGSFFRKIVWMV